MAQQNTLDFLIAAQVTGQEQMAKLIREVGALRAETDKLREANKELSSSTDAVIRNGVRYNNALDAQSKAMRQQRQGTQQLGMQINDFATSVSTGASVTQALNQQLGQVGYAMSMMGGTAGKVGAFLAGPWGAAITIGVMALGPLIDKLFQSKDAAEQAAQAHYKYLDAVAAGNMADLIKGELDLIKMQEKRLRLQLQLAKTPLPGGQPGGSRFAIPGERSRLQQQLDQLDADIRWQQLAVTRGNQAREQLRRNQQNIETRSVRTGGGSAGRRKAEISEIDKLREAQKKIIDQFQAGALAPAEFERQLKAVTEAHKEAINPADEYLKKFEEQDRALEAFLRTADGMLQKQLPEWQQKLATLKEQYAKIAGTTRETTAATQAYATAIQAALTGPIDEQIRKYDDMIAKANGVTDSFESTAAAIIERAKLEGASLDEITAKLLLLQQRMDEFKVAERNAEIRKSFEEIGMSVNKAFQGMLTGAMSWKDGMKGIINAVINELWRLFVVQQIVGMVTGGLNSLFGFSPSAKLAGDVAGTMSARPDLFANGTVNAPGGMAWVGERGPELVNLPRGSQVIPAHRAQSMGRGGVTINVDARGSADPAAVRAQVQQGIIEAAPSIIAAAEARTVQGLRRPRLGGAIK